MANIENNSKSKDRAIGLQRLKNQKLNSPVIDIEGEFNEKEKELSPMEGDLLSNALQIYSENPEAGLELLKSAGEAKDITDKFKKDFSGEALAADSMLALDEAFAGGQPSFSLSRIEKGEGDKRSAFDIEGLAQGRDIEKQTFKGNQALAVMRAKQKIDKIARDILEADREFGLKVKSQDRNNFFRKIKTDVNILNSVIDTIPEGEEKENVKKLRERMMNSANTISGGSNLEFN